MTSPSPSGCDPARTTSGPAFIGRVVISPMPTATGAHRHPAQRAVPAPFPPWCAPAMYSGDAAAVPDGRGQAGVLRAGRGKRLLLEDPARELCWPGSTSPAFQGARQNLNGSSCGSNDARRHAPSRAADRRRRRCHPRVDGHAAGESVPAIAIWLERRATSPRSRCELFARAQSLLDRYRFRPNATGRGDEETDEVRSARGPRHRSAAAAGIGHPAEDFARYAEIDDRALSDRRLPGHGDSSVDGRNQSADHELADGSTIKTAGASARNPT